MAEFHFVSNPSTCLPVWYVWDARSWPPKPIYTGTMEECGQVAAGLNANHQATADSRRGRGEDDG